MSAFLSRRFRRRTRIDEHSKANPNIVVLVNHKRAAHRSGYSLAGIVSIPTTPESPSRFARHQVARLGWHPNISISSGANPPVSVAICACVDYTVAIAVDEPLMKDLDNGTKRLFSIVLPTRLHARHTSSIRIESCPGLSSPVTSQLLAIAVSTLEIVPSSELAIQMMLANSV